MWFTFAFLLFIVASITSVQGFLDISTTTIKPNIAKVDVEKSETLNEKNFSKETHQSGNFTDNFTTEKIPYKDSSTRESSRGQQGNKGIPEIDESFNMRWFLGIIFYIKIFSSPIITSFFYRKGGAFAGVMVSFIAFYVYGFYKSRTEAGYQNV